MSVIEASSVRCQTMADSTLRLTIDIEPRFANDAFALFGKAGTSLAVAALKPGHALKSSEPVHETGYWCLRAVQRCQEPEFREWIKTASLQGKQPETAEDAAAVVREVCGIKSRRELDTDMKARDLFQKKLDFPYTRWLKTAQPA